ncbi:DNA-binding NarL/FixJ family response regulator [Streptomyces sp. B3I8]|nr:DNA-binding NarL/FixJ family response regulator [Streptomyces sp. B3I8]
MGRVNGVRVATSLRHEPPGRRVLIVTGHGRPGRPERVTEAAVRGFAPKAVGARRLAEVVHAVHAGIACAETELAADATRGGNSPPTAREAQVGESAADGTPVAQIAGRAAPAEGTVRTHLSSAAAEPGVEDRHPAVRPAREHGWV